MPQADLALAALVIDLAELLYQGEFASLQAQQAVPTTTLSHILTACNRDAEQTLIDDGQYLSVLGFTGERCTVQALWQHLGQTLQSRGARHVALWHAHLQWILQHGPLARRILHALVGQHSPDTLHAVYARLVANLREGAFFIP